MKERVGRQQIAEFIVHMGERPEGPFGENEIESDRRQHDQTRGGKQGPPATARPAADTVSPTRRPAELADTATADNVPAIVKAPEVTASSINAR